MAVIDVLIKYFPSFNVALGETLKLTAVSLFFATVLGVIFGLFKVSGIKPGKAMSKIILPQAFRTMMPSIINQFIISMKDTSLISIIGIRELTQNGKIIAANSASLVMAIWVAVALYYLVICTILSRIAVIVERKVSYGKQ